MSRLHADKPLVNLELLYMFGTSGLTFFALLLSRLSGLAGIPVMLIGAVPLSILAISGGLRIFYPLTRWTLMKIDGIDLNNGDPKGGGQSPEHCQHGHNIYDR